MKDEEKTKEELIRELKLLREKHEEVDQQIKNRSERIPIQTRIEFIGDFDILEGQSVNISEGGICFKISTDLPFELRYEQEGIIQQQRANLVWVRKSEGRGYLLGLKFVSQEPYPEL